MTNQSNTEGPSEQHQQDQVRLFYRALAAGDAATLRELLHPSFVGHTTEGLPFGLGGTHDGPEAMARDFWWSIGRHYRAHAEPEQFSPAGSDGLLVLGRYTGTAREGGGRLDAAFAHVLRFTDGQISGLRQYTDSQRWHAALPPPPAGRRELRTVSYGVAHGVASIRLARSAAGNAINPTLVEDLYEAVFRAGADPSVRSILLSAAGRTFTTGGDLAMFAQVPRDELPSRLRQMIDIYHLALDRLTRLDAPVICAVGGAAAGGGLGLVHVADIVVAADTAKFALGYAAIGLTSDGGNSWFLPRIVGMRRAQQMFLLNRQLSAAEALEWGLVTEVVAAEELQARASELAGALADGPTRAFGRMKRLLQDSCDATLREQLSAEITEMVDAGADDDATEGIAAFRDKRRAEFRGQ